MCLCMHVELVLQVLGRREAGGTVWVGGGDRAWVAPWTDESRVE